MTRQFRTFLLYDGMCQDVCEDLIFEDKPAPSNGSLVTSEASDSIWIAMDSGWQDEVGPIGHGEVRVFFVEGDENHPNNNQWSAGRIARYLLTF